MFSGGILFSAIREIIALCPPPPVAECLVVRLVKNILVL